MCLNGGVKVIPGKPKGDFALVVSWVQSFFQEIRLRARSPGKICFCGGAALQIETAIVAPN